jgi:hypothetical protein
VVLSPRRARTASPIDSVAGKPTILQQAKAHFGYSIVLEDVVNCRQLPIRGRAELLKG